MCASMADIHSATAEIRRGKKKEESRGKKKPQGKNIMVCPIPQGDHNDNKPVKNATKVKTLVKTASERYLYHVQLTCLMPNMPKYKITRIRTFCSYY